KVERDAGSLLDRALRVELAGDVGAADQRERDARGAERVCEVAPWLLARANDDRVDGEHPRHTRDAKMQAVDVDALVGDAGEHRHAATTKQRAPDPAGRLREVLAHFRRLALKKPDAARRLRPPRFADATRACQHRIDAPFVAERIERVRVVVVPMRQQLGDVETDAAGADDRDSLAGGASSFDDVDVARDARMREAFERGPARQYAGRDDDRVERAQIVDLRDAAETALDAKRREQPIEIAQRLAELLLARNSPRQVELAADRRGRLEQRH